MLRSRGFIVAAALGLSGCASAPVCSVQNAFAELFQPQGSQALGKAIRQFEDGELAASAKSLQGALDHGLADHDRIQAHKHLAFIHCASQRERECREEFRRALLLDPAMDLHPAERGHPMWGPVFQSLKKERRQLASAGKSAAHPMRAFWQPGR